MFRTVSFRFLTNTHPGRIASELRRRVPNEFWSEQLIELSVSPQEMSKQSLGLANDGRRWLGLSMDIQLSRRSSCGRRFALKHQRSHSSRSPTRSA